MPNCLGLSSATSRCRIYWCLLFLLNTPTNVYLNLCSHLPWLRLARLRHRSKTKLEAKGVRSAQMLALRDSPPRSDKGRSESMSALSVSSIGGGVGDRSPTISPVPSRAGVSLLNGGKASGAAGAGGNGVGRLAGSRRRALREVPSSRVGPLDSTGTGGASPCPAGPALSAKAPAACSNASGVSGANEESAFFALEPVVPVKVYTERDVRREVEAAKAGLDHGSDWQIWVGAMRRLAGVALGGGAREFPGVLVGHVRASVHEAVGHKVRRPHAVYVTPYLDVMMSLRTGSPRLNCGFP